MLGETSIRLREAIINGNLLIVKRLLKRYPDLLTNIDPTNGWSSLHYASYHGRYLICVYLIQLGHDSNEELYTFKGNTCVHLALINGHEQTTHLLLQHFPQFINKRGAKGRTPVHIACITDNFRCLSLLIGVGANLTLRDDQGETPLHICLAYSSMECLKLLFQEGYQDVILVADQVSDNYGWKPEEVAETFDFAKIYSKLKRDYKPIITSTTPNVIQSANFRKTSFQSFRTPIVESKNIFDEGIPPMLNVFTPTTSSNTGQVSSPLSRLPTISTSRKASFSTVSKKESVNFSSSRKSSDSNRASPSLLKKIGSHEESIDGSYSSTMSNLIYNKPENSDSTNNISSFTPNSNNKAVDLEHTVTNVTVGTNTSYSIHSISPKKETDNLSHSEISVTTSLGRTFSNDTIQRNKYILDNLSEVKIGNKKKKKATASLAPDRSKMRNRLSLLNIPIARVRDKDYKTEYNV